MRDLVIDRREWLRAVAQGDYSVLLRGSDQKRCCVGIYLRALGVPDSELLQTPTADGLKVPSEAAWLLGTNLVGELVGDSLDADDLYRVNDTLDIDDAEREQQVAEAFAAHGVRVTFVDGDEPAPSVNEDQGGDR